MRLSELFLDRYLYRDFNQDSETKDSSFVSVDSSEAEPASIPSGGAAQDVNTGNVMIDSALIPSTTIDVGDYGWTQSCAFASDDIDTVSWGAGTFLDAAGNSYSIDAGDTGNMTAKTYIYLSLLDSETVYQKSTTSSDSVGTGKVLIAVAKDESDAATYNLVEADQIVGDNILVNTIDAGKIVVGSLIVGTNVAIGTAEDAAGVTTIVGNTVTTGYVDALEITVVGTLTAGTINASTVTISNLTVGTNVGLGTAEDSAGVTTIVGNTVTTSYVNALDITATGQITSGSMQVVNGGNTIGFTPAGTNAIFSGPTGTPTFYVTPAGVMTTKSGVIGNWNINSTSIYTGTEDHSGYTTNAGDITIYSNGSNASIHAKNFYIDTSGNITATSVTLTGSLTTAAGSSISGTYISNINAGTITTGTLSVGAAGQPASIVLNRSGSDGFLTWTGGNKIWSDNSEYMGFDAGGGRYYFYDDTVPMVLFQNNSQAIFYDGINSEGNFNVDSSYAARFEGVPVYLATSGTDCRIQGSSTVISYEATNDHNFYVGGTASVDAVIDANIWSQGDLLAEGSKTFLTSHPDGTEGKMLRYTAQESPEVILRHRGKAKTDNTNKATITLPEHYTLITDKNGDVTVNLTSIGDNRVFLEKEPTNEEINIESNNPNVSFHYEVMAVRDGYLDAKVEFNINDNNLSDKDKVIADGVKKRKIIKDEAVKKQIIVI